MNMNKASFVLSNSQTSLMNHIAIHIGHNSKSSVSYLIHILKKKKTDKQNQVSVAQSKSESWHPREEENLSEYMEVWLALEARMMWSEPTGQV